MSLEKGKGNIPVDGRGRVRAGHPALADDHETGITVTDDSEGTDGDGSDASQLVETLAGPPVREDAVELAGLLGRDCQ